ncbi:uncharacterized protein [Hyperolius riggenbachi]|uniref:uncharacterized protein n=1 Tax=Hyperolius riggenbachi TaxID=752182 RepID=UPI0035A26F94
MDHRFGQHFGFQHPNIYGYTCGQVPHCPTQNSGWNLWPYYLMHPAVQPMIHPYYYSQQQVPFWSYQPQLAPMNINELHFSHNIQQAQSALQPLNTQEYAPSAFQDSKNVVDKKSIFNWDNSSKENRPSEISSEVIGEHSVIVNNKYELQVDPGRLVSPIKESTEQSEYEKICNLSTTFMENCSKDYKQPFDVLESLPPDLLVCNYEDAEVSSIISSMDYFYKGIACEGMEEEQTISHDPDTFLSNKKIKSPSIIKEPYTNRSIPVMKKACLQQRRVSLQSSVKWLARIKRKYFGLQKNCIQRVQKSEFHTASTTILKS